MTLLVDFETRSRADLAAVGGRNYAEDPSTEAICAVAYDPDTRAYGLWLPGMAPPEGPFVAHNASGFDRFIGARVWGAPIEGWADTSEAARRAGLPGALDALGTRWLNRPKDAEGSRFTVGLSTCRRPSGKGPDAIPPAVWRTYSAAEKRARGRQAEITPDVLARVVAYCASDVEIMAEGWPRLQPFLDGGVFGGWEADVLAVDRVVNDRGVAFDSGLAAALLECDARNGEAALVAAAGVLGWAPEQVRAVANAPAQFAAFTGTPDAQAATLEALLLNPATPTHVAALAHARQALATIAAGKLRAGLARVSPDGRLRDGHRYYGAHTGRWSGKGMQLQNLPRPEKRFEGLGAAEVDAIVGRAGVGLDDGEIMIALRACVTAAPGHTLVVCDFSGVEARALAWCAGDRAALDVFASGRDPYKTAAAPMFGVAYDDVTKTQRNAGKMAELACGYGGGVNALLKIARSNRFDFATAGVDPADVVASYRAQHAPIVRFWRALEAAFIAAVRGVPGRVDRFEFAPSTDGASVAIFLPSGRPIVYNDVGLAQGAYGPSPYYVGTRGREHTYGGKIAENVIQAFCRDLMADALVRAEAAGLRPVLHVHDEIVCEVPAHAGEEGLAELRGIMLALPYWAEGFPVGAAGHHGERYRK